MFRNAEKIKREYFSIPNLMGYFRILMLPVFLLMYYNADTRGEYAAAFTVLIISFLTDFFDGKIARKFNMVTDFGKILDPVADKLTQGVLAIAVASNYPLMGSFFLLFLMKEGYMGLMGLYLLRKKNLRNGAQWYGKICTAVMDVGILFLLLFPKTPYRIANLVILVMMVFMIFSLVQYLRFHITALLGAEKRGRKIHWGLVVLLIIAYMLMGASIPYLKQPEISEAYRESFDSSSFYAESVSADRASVVEENGAALEERIRLISQAKERVVLSTFDFRSDTAGKEMLAALVDAADRDVQVQILLDGFNFLLHMREDPYFYALAQEKNIEIRIYNPVNFMTPWKWMSRMHDKYLIADESVYILGGRNTFDYFLGDQDGYKNYDRDVLVYNTGGADSSVYQVLDYFEDIWNLEYCRTWKPAGWIKKTICVKEALAELREICGNLKAEHSEWFGETDYEARTLPTNKITLLSNPTDLYSKEPRVFYSLGQLMMSAGKNAVIHTPYIMCNEMMYQTFRDITDNHVDVTLMTNSAKNNGNPFGAVDFVLNKEKILDTGLHVLEYNGGISYHGKSMIIDDDIAIVGSFNMDMKSVYQDTELMLVINSREVNEQLRQNFDEYQKEAEEAQVWESHYKELYENDRSLVEKAQRALIRIVDPFLRFLL